MRHPILAPGVSLLGHRLSVWHEARGTWVTAYDGEAAQMDTTGGRWQVVCEKHGAILSVGTLERAKADARLDPTEFCEKCRDEPIELPDGSTLHLNLDSDPNACFTSTSSSNRTREVRMADTQQDGLIDETAELAASLDVGAKQTHTVKGFDPAALFLLDLGFDQLFELADSSPGAVGPYRCKGCGKLVKQGERQKHHGRHKANRETITKERTMADKNKPAKQTAKDRGVPKEYLAENGNFKPGMDARYKSDLILAILEQPNSKALVKFTKMQAEKLFAAFPHWADFLARKTEILQANAEKLAAKAAEKAAKETAKAAEKKARTAAKSTEQVVAEEQAAHDAAVAPNGKAEAKPDPKPASTKSASRGRKPVGAASARTSRRSSTKK